MDDDLVPSNRFDMAIAFQGYSEYPDSNKLTLEQLYHYLHTHKIENIILGQILYVMHDKNDWIRAIEDAIELSLPTPESLTQLITMGNPYSANRYHSWKSALNIVLCSGKYKISANILP